MVRSVLIALALIAARPLCAAEEVPFVDQAKQLAQAYIDGFGHPNTHVCYHHRLDGPKGVDALSSPGEIAKQMVRGKHMPFGYGSGVQDVPLENGQFLMALCDAYDATKDEDLAAMARWVFQGMKLVATVSPVPGFVPRGPHPDGKSYYPDSSRDQTCAFVEAMWRYANSPLATDPDRAFIADALAKVARRMERNDYVLKVEDNSRMAHVGWGWKQHTLIGAATLLAHLAAVRDVTGDAHWAELYDRFSAEKDGVRWRLLAPDSPFTRRPMTLYSNQFFTSLVVLVRTERDPQRVAQVKELMRTLAERSLNSNVFDPDAWRRLDWAGKWPEAETERALQPFGLTLSRPTTVLDLWKAFDPQSMAAKSWRRQHVNNKLLMGLPTVAFHKALLSEDPRLVAQVAPHVEAMVKAMLSQGHLYTRGENFNRATILGLHLVALRAK